MLKNQFRLLFSLCLLGLAGFAPSAHAWWNSEWTLRKQITIDTAGGGIAEPIGSVPLLVRLHEGNFRFDAAKQDGSDLRFVATDDKTLLPYHIEKIDSVLNEAFVWVKVPDLKPSGKTTLWLYYGNAGNKATRVEDAKATYDDDTVLVYHFSEHGQPAVDSSGNGNVTVNVGVPSDSAQIGTGLRLDGHSPISISAASLAWNERASFTWSAWIKATQLNPNAVIFSRHDNGRGLVIGLDNGVPYVEVTSAGSTSRSQASGSVSANTWKHLAVVATSPTVTLYLDGNAIGSLTASVPNLLTNPQLGESFSGEIDDLIISKTARPLGYIKMLAQSQGSDATGKLVTLGDDTQQSNWMSALKTGYVGVIIGSLTVDGWVVIGILGVMSIVSWIVMIGKGRYLGRIGRGNTTFLKSWGQVASDLSVLDQEDDVRSMGGHADAAEHRVMKESPLFRVYHIGVEEIRHRLSEDRGVANKVLSARSIQAIRASLDGGVVREMQRLNSSMVLLTIAISGGPFLGLLGTVVGVMITFAAVAMAGDVNVNAIAPGIAAALAATVAGLAVAIPALFGYNYLLTQIKSASNDMHVFIDEFVTKLAEFYSETADT